jgi:lysine 2,3-aminomutase
MESLIGHTSGYAVPTFVVDAPGGGGKIRLMPQYLVSESDGAVILRNYEGVITTYHEPEDVKTDVDDEKYRKKYHLKGVAGLFEGGQVSMEPESLERGERIKEWKAKHKEDLKDLR